MVEIRNGSMHFDREQQHYGRLPEAMPLEQIHTALGIVLDTHEAVTNRRNQLLDGWYVFDGHDRDLLNKDSRRIPVLQGLFDSFGRMIGPHFTDSLIDEILARS